MQITLDGKLAVVTGAAQGIGHAIAKRLAQCGAQVVVNDLDERRIATAVDAIRAAIPGATVRGAAADLSSAAGCNRLVEQVPDCDILVNNAAIYETADFFEIPDATWQRYFEPTSCPGSGCRGPTCRTWARATGGASYSSVPSAGSARRPTCCITRLPRRRSSACRAASRNACRAPASR